MISKLFNLNILIIILISLSVSGCGGKFGGVDARKVSPNPKERVKKNLEEGKGFRLNDMGKKNSGTTYEFASSNELWRASLDVIDFMPLTTANYNGGIIVTDWYSEDQKIGESVKITIRFLTNELRADALVVKVFYKKCETILNCEITETEGKIKEELTKSILKQAAIYKKQGVNKNFQKRPEIKD